MNKSFKDKVMQLTREGTRPENIAIILNAEEEEVKTVIAEASKENMEKTLAGGKRERDAKIQEEYVGGKSAAYLAEKYHLHIGSIYNILRPVKKHIKSKKTLPKKDSSWIAWDLVIDDLSTARQYKESFSKILKTKSPDDLITTLEEKAEKLGSE